MNWAEFHQKSERLAAEAQALALTDPGRAKALYVEAAKLEAEALLEIDISKVRTLGITAVSAVALWFKAREFAEAQKLAYRALGEIDLPGFAVEQLQALLQSIWSEGPGSPANQNCSGHSKGRLKTRGGDYGDDIQH